MNKIYKVIYSKVKQCYIVVSELAKSHVKSSHGSNGQQKAALTMSVLLALGAFTFAFGPATAEAAETKTKTNGSNFIGVERPDVTFDTKDNDSKYANYNGAGAHGANAITIGLKAVAADDTITIGDRNASKSLGSVYIGRGTNMPTGTTMPDTTDDGYWATSVGYQSDATGYGSIAIGSNAVANNSYDKDSTGHGITLRVTSGDGKTVTLNGKPDIQRASVAIGYGASADNGNIAIGSYSDASTDLRTAKTTDGQEIKSYLTDQKADSYVSVGKTNALRRISNVADGASASDVATVGQLQALAAKSGTYKAGFGIEITPDTTTKENTIKLSRNLGRDMDSTDNATLVADESKSALVLGGRVEEGQSKKGQIVEKPYGAFGQDSVVVGGANNIADKDGVAAVVIGGTTNTASAQYSTVAGGNNNDAFGNESSVFGGFDNDAFGAHATLSGGSMNRAYGAAASVFGGGVNSALGDSSVAVGGLQSTVNGAFAVGIAGGSTNANHALAAGNGANVTVENGTAIGYQATTDEAKTIAFGHDAGDVSGYTIKWKQRTDGKTNADHTTNDYTQVPDSVTPTTYKDAYYNRLVKVADGQDDHDVVVMEQLKQYAEKNASNIGKNLTVPPVYQTDDHGNIKLGSDNKPLIDKEKTEQKRKDDQTTNKNDWGQALGAAPFTAGTATTATDASTSDQLVTGKTLYNYDAPTAAADKTLNYVSANNTTGQNLSALDAQVKANADELNKPNRNIKYYSVKTLPLTVDGYTNENNDGAKGMGSLAAGFVTHADGIASTVAGSYSGVINSGNVQGRDLRGAAALSYGTFNVNQNTDTAKEHSGVANSIVGQANMTTDSNAAIIVGAGNSVTNSYRAIDKDKISQILSSAQGKNAQDLQQALQDAVPTSGAQVMVMGGGNSVDKAYMTQVVGVGNNVTGNDATYIEGTSTQYNYVDGFQNTLTNGKNDYIIGSNNTITGSSVDTNKSNLVLGDNHKLTDKKNNVILGSADDKDTETKASDAVIIGHNANVSVDGGVALGNGSVSVATADADVEGYDPTSTATNKASSVDSSTWKATTGAVSIGGVNGDKQTTRRITNLAAGFNDTDAVNVAQIKKLANIDASNIGANLKGSDGQTKASDDEIRTNENDWGNAIGHGVIADPTKTDTNDPEKNGSQQLVTGGTVYKALNGGLTKVVIGTPGKNGQDGKDGKPGTIGLVGPAGTNGKDGAVDITIQNGKDGEVGKDGKDGIKGANGVDGTNGINRIVYEDKNGQHQTATMEDGLKFAGDDGQTDEAKVIAKKLNNTLNIIGGANKDDLTENNIGVNNADGKLKIQLAKDLTGITSISNQKTTGEGDSKTTTGAKIDLKDDGSISVNNGKITDVASGLTGDKYDETEDKNHAANLSDVNKMINSAADDDGTIGKKLAAKANVDASNIGANLKYKEDGTAVTDADKIANENLWGKAIGMGKIADDTVTDAATNGSQQLVTGGTVYKETRAAKTDAEGNKIQYSYIDANATAGQNFAKLDSSLQTISKTAGAHTVLKVEGQKAGTVADEYTGTNLKLHQDTDPATGQVTYDLKLADKVIIGSTDGKKVTIDGTQGEVSGLTNKDWKTDETSQNQYKDSTKAATEAQVKKAYDEAISKAGENAANNDIHVADGNQAVSNDNTISMNLVDKNGGTHGTVTITDVAKASDLGKISGLNKDLKKTDGTAAATVVDAINSVDNKIGDQKYFTEDGKTHTVTNGSSITQAIGDLDSAVQNATKQAGQHTIVSTPTDDKNINVKNIAKDGEAANYQISLNKDLNVDSVTAKTVTTDNLNANSATIGGDKGITIKDNTVSGLKDTDIKEGSTNAVNGNTIWKELRPTSDGSYIHKDNTTAQNLTTLDTQVKKTSGLINSDGKTIKIGSSDTATKVDVSGKDGQSRVITGVKTDTKDATSAASVGYVNDMNAANTQQIYHDMNSAYSHVENDISRAAAGSNALAALHPMEFDPDDKAQYALGYGHYRNSNAGAVGVFYQPDENSLFSLGASFGNGDAGINAGVTFKFGPGGSGHHALTKTQMAKVIDAQSKEIDALKKDNADKDKRIDALEQKVNEILAKVEKDKA